MKEVVREEGSLRWEEFVRQVGFRPAVTQSGSDGRWDRLQSIGLRSLCTVCSWWWWFSVCWGGRRGITDVWRSSDAHKAGNTYCFPVN